MSIAEEIEKKIEKKKAEIAELERQLTECKAYVLAYQDVWKLATKGEAGEGNRKSGLREGSDMSKVRDAICKEGQALNVDALLVAIGKEPTTKNKTSLAGSLSSYAAKGRIFKRGDTPNTFTLIDFDTSVKKPLTNEPPQNFGLR